MKKAIAFLILAAVVLGASSAPALTRRSDKECLLCHVLWFDTASSNQKTLLQKTDSAIVVAGSTGLVSSEAMCATCHDGYVVDSRITINTDNPHHKLKKVPPELKLPEILRLDSNNEIYCGTCHTLHDVQGSAEVGSTPFMRMNNERSQMCMTCHGGKTDKSGVVNHPVFKTSKTIDFRYAVEKGAQFGTDRELICQSCHLAHGQKALISSPKDSTLCVLCHQKQKSLITSKHDLRSTLPESQNITKQQPAESGPCGSCHLPHRGGGQKLWARTLKSGAAATQMCLSCHGTAAGLNIKNVGNHSHPVGVKPAAKNTPSSQLPLFTGNATPSKKGRVQCFTCHNVHRWDPGSKSNTGAKTQEGDSSNSFLRVANDAASALCLNCHGDKKSLVLSDHNLKATATQEKNINGDRVGRSGPCGACHIPHNAAGWKLWAKPLVADRDMATQMCTGCHNQKGAAKAKLIGENYHPVGVTLQNLSSTDAEQSGPKQLPLYGTGGERSDKGKMVCMTCHDPHIWNPKNPTASSGKPQNREGDASTSFLRKANFPSSALCKTCHSDAGRVDGTSHDLNITAPQATNLLGQTVKASGACGACHLVHNSPNSLRLWARPYGPVIENNPRMNILCTSCHSEGNIAGTKIPPITTHPAGKLITNIRPRDPQNRNYTLIFDDAGTKTRVGEIACASCHNAHQWTPPYDAQGDQTQSSTRYKFLRNMSRDILCMDCHGPDGLYRYLYFHDPVKRKGK